MLSVGVGRYSGSQNIGSQGDTDGFVGGKSQKSDKHGRNDGSSRHSRKSCAYAGSESGNNTYNNRFKHILHLLQVMGYNG